MCHIVYKHVCFIFCCPYLRYAFTHSERGETTTDWAIINQTTKYILLFKINPFPHTYILLTKNIILRILQAQVNRWVWVDEVLRKYLRFMDIKIKADNNVWLKFLRQRRHCNLYSNRLLSWLPGGQRARARGIMRSQEQIAPSIIGHYVLVPSVCLWQPAASPCVSASHLSTAKPFLTDF